ncbi:MAG: EXPERA domain-containing protein [Myxococcota bacterium]
MRRVIPLRRRPVDILLLAFFALNLVFITYMIDTEQLVIDDPTDFEYPVWPPRFIIDAVHWWGFNFDPALIARPPWWRATIWIDQIFFGPFYAFAVYAYAKGKEWIRIPSIIWGSVMITNVTIILFEEVLGPHASDDLGIVLFANASWILFPVITIARMWAAGEHPFTEPVSSSAGVPAAPPPAGAASGEAA